MGVVTRVKSIEVKNFRGFKGGPHRVDTDADVVLLSGPNGYGKTSLLEALLLGLTGWYDVSGDPDKDLETFVERALVSQPRNNGKDERAEVHEFSISYECTRESIASDKIAVSWTRSSGTISMPANFPWSRLGQIERQSLMERELDARLTGFFQGRVERLFDQAASGRTFRDVFEPVPSVVRALDEESFWDELLKTVAEAKGELVFNDELSPSVDERRNELRLAWQQLSSVLNQLFPLLDWNVEVPGTIPDEGVLDDFAMNLAGVSSSGETLRNDFRRHIDQALKRAIRREERHAPVYEEKNKEDVRKREEVLGERERLKREFPNLEADLKLFSAQEDLPDALHIFRALQSFAEQWGQGSFTDGQLERVRHEFSLVSVADAAECAQILDDFLTPRREAKSKLDRLEDDLRRLDAVLRGGRGSKRLDKLRRCELQLKPLLSHLVSRWESSHEAREHETKRAAREQARKKLDDLSAALEACAESVSKITAPDQRILEYLAERFTAVMGRFSMVAGCLPVSLRANDRKSDVRSGGRRTTKIVFNDGRELVHLSSGQKAQTALALMVAQNQGAAEYLGHRILLLDDITTDYDLSNLSRQALLLRQLAYGDSRPDSLNRRQIFISSHHEDMTNQLLDMLAPPRHGRMRLVRFRGWSPERGPDFEVLEVEPSSGIDEESLRKDLEVV